MSWCFVLSQSEVRGGRLGDEVTSQTQAIQSIANIIPCHILLVQHDNVSKHG
jgi:hypothetical protein